MAEMAGRVCAARPPSGQPRPVGTGWRMRPSIPGVVVMSIAVLPQRFMLVVDRLWRRLMPVRYASRSIFAAMMKSLRDKPSTVWVQSVTSTFPQVTVNSG